MLLEAKRAVLAKVTNTNYSTMALSHAHLYSEVESPNIRFRKLSEMRNAKAVKTSL